MRYKLSGIKIKPKAILCLSETSDIAREIETGKDKKKSWLTSSFSFKKT
jgi:hypothetical protein